MNQSKVIVIDKYHTLLILQAYCYLVQYYVPNRKHIHFLFFFFFWNKTLKNILKMKNQQKAFPLRSKYLKTSIINTRTKWAQLQTQENSPLIPTFVFPSLRDSKQSKAKQTNKKSTQVFSKAFCRLLGSKIKYLDSYFELLEEFQ